MDSQLPQRQIKRPFSATIMSIPEIVKIKATQNEQAQKLQTQNLQKKSIESEIQIKSTISTTRRKKIPDSMRKFLKDRKYIRQTNKLSNFSDSYYDNKIGKMQHISQKVEQDLRNHTKGHQLMNQTMKKLNDNSIVQIHEEQNKMEFNHQKNVSIVEKTFEQTNYNQSTLYLTKKSLKMIDQQVKGVEIEANILELQKATILCSICQGKFTEQNIIKAFACRHLYCIQCTKSYIKYKINLFQQVSCPQQSCNEVLDTQTKFYKSFTKRQRRLYKKIHNFYLTQTDKSKKLCPRQQCEGIISIKQNSAIQACQKCKTNFCSICYLESHEGVCREYQIKFIEDTLHYRQCSKCKIVVQRLDGCNHITCKCGYQFCYICGEKWKHDHLCRPHQQTQQQNGCDWGENWQDHFIFLIKMPLKFILTTVYTTFWFVISFAAAPYNIFFFIYWILLIFIGGPIEFIFEEEQRQTWQILLLFLIFPILMIYCIPKGIVIFLERFQQQCPYITDGYRWIIRI